VPTEWEVIERSGEPLAAEDLTRGLRDLGLEPGGILIAHVSLSALGWIAGGAQAVVEALLAALGPNGTLVMASQSAQLSDPAYWSDPPIPRGWIERVRETLPAYDPELTPPRGMGAVVECFLQSRKTRRSPHPIYSFCAQGPAAERIVTDHPLSPSFGEESPLARIYRRHANVLLLGVGHERNTSLHLAEHRANWPGKWTYLSGAPLRTGGRTRWTPFSDMVVTTSDFAAIAAAYAESGPLATGRIGNAKAELMPMRPLVDFAVDWMSAHRK